MLRPAVLLVALAFVAAVSTVKIDTKVEILNKLINADLLYLRKCVQQKKLIMAEIAQYSAFVKGYLAAYTKAGNKTTPAQRQTFITNSQKLIADGNAFVALEEKFLGLGRILVLEAGDAIDEVESIK